jgi:WS/DGAT/MGAT family acyltransferase
VHVPFELDNPRWIEDPDFDLDFHIRRAALPAPGGRAELDAFVGYLLSRPLDRSRPLWELHVVEGLADGRVALVSKTHHAAVDGVSGTDLLASLVDLTPDAGDPEPPALPWTPDRVPNQLELVAESIGSLIRQPWRGLKGTQRLVRAMAKDQLARFDPSPTTAAFASPATPFNTTVTPHRLVHLFELPMADLKAVKHAAGSSLNDVLLASVGGALRTYLLERDELPANPLVAFVPVSTRSTAAGGEGGNETSAVFSTIATDVADPVERLQTINAAMTAAKAQHKEIGAATLIDFTEIAGPAAAALAGRFINRFRINELIRACANVVVSNIPGPPVPLYVAGAKVEAIYPLGPVADGSALNITVMSYLDTMYVGLAADRATVPDIDRVGELLEGALAELVHHHVPAPAEPDPPRTGATLRRRRVPATRA